MRLPKEIVGKNKLRDLHICSCYVQGMSVQEIKDSCHPELSLRRLFKIISDNAAFVNPRVAWPKARRIHLLQKIAVNAGSEINKRKDILDVLSELRKEIEGEKSLVDQSHHEHITIIVDPLAAKEENFELQTELPAEQVRP